MISTARRIRAGRDAGAPSGLSDQLLDELSLHVG